MADHFVDSVTGTSTMTGHTMDDPWDTVEYALESGALAAGDKVWCRSNISETPASDILPAYSGTVGSWIELIGCPRPSRAIASSDWTNGSTAVVIDDNDMTESAHEGRYITAPDGETYFITRVIDSNDIVIDREYAGATVTNQAATILADPDYAEFAAIDDSAWVIKVATWLADGASRPVIDFNDGALQLYSNGRSYFAFKNFIFMDSSDTAGILYIRSANASKLEGCLIKQSANNTLIAQIYQGYVFLKRVIIKGSGAGAAQIGLLIAANGYAKIKDVAIYNCGDWGLQLYGDMFLNGLNIGVEVANGDDDITTYYSPKTFGMDLKLGGTNGTILYTSASLENRISIENNERVLGDHRTYFTGGYFERATLTAATTPNKKLSDDAVKIVPNLNTHVSNNPDLAYKILEHRVWADTSEKDYKYWVYNNLAATINDTTATDNLFLKVTYVSGYDDTSEYVYTESLSTQIDILAAADATDWDYLEVTGVIPAVASWVILEIYESQYSAAGTIFIDPEVVIA